MQQCNNLANWYQLRRDFIDASRAAKLNPSLALGALSVGFNAALYWIEYYLYGVDALLLMFWAVALVFSVWEFQPAILHNRERMFGIVSKLAAFLLPVIFVGLHNVHTTGFISTFVLVNFVVLLGLAFSVICIILILAKYLWTRMGVVSFGTASLSLRPNDSFEQSLSSRWARLSARVDPWFIVRFTIASVLLCTFEIFLVSFCIRRYDNALKASSGVEADYSIHTSVLDIIDYIPGPLPSLLVFFIFGTTPPLRARYREIFAPLKCFRKDRPASSRITGLSTQEWTRMPSRHSQDAVEHDLEAGDIEIYELADTEIKRKSTTHTVVEEHEFPSGSETDVSESSKDAHTIHVENDEKM
ncbi:hypothetical protein MBLNU459_g8394t1 [Dothideomycetes sp. NU459]